MTTETPADKPDTISADVPASRTEKMPTVNDAAHACKVDERRKAFRTAARYKGRIEISGYAFPVMTWDVSMGGARCSVQGVFPPNTSCTLYLSDDKGNEMPLPCKTVRSTGFDTRVCFQALKPKQKDFLIALTNKFTS